MTRTLVDYIEQDPDFIKTEQDYQRVLDRISFYRKWLRKLIFIDTANGFAKIHARIDMMVQQKLKESPGVAQCKRGCNFCCHWNVDINHGEAQLIIQYCKKNSITINKQYLSEQLEFSRDELPLSKSHSTCLFLKDGECSIYPVRPIACRKYYVGTAPQFCNSMEYGVKGLMIGTVFIEEAEYLLSGLGVEARSAGRMQELLLKHL